MCLFNCVDICTDDANSMVGKTDAFIGFKAVEPIQSHSWLLKKKRSQFYLRMSKSINFIKYSSLGTHLKNILIDDMGSKHRACPLHNKV